MASGKSYRPGFRLKGLLSFVERARSPSRRALPACRGRCDNGVLSENAAVGFGHRGSFAGFGELVFLLAKASYIAAAH